MFFNSFHKLVSQQFLTLCSKIVVSMYVSFFAVLLQHVHSFMIKEFGPSCEKLKNSNGEFLRNNKRRISHSFRLFNSVYTCLYLH